MDDDKSLVPEEAVELTDEDQEPVTEEKDVVHIEWSGYI